MPSHRLSLRNQLRALSGIRLLARAAQSDNTFETAQLIDTLTGSSAPATFKYKNKFNKRDRVDFFKVDLAAGSSFSFPVT